MAADFINNGLNYISSGVDEKSKNWVSLERTKEIIEM